MKALPRAALLGLFVASAAADWFELPQSVRPRWRYSHGATSQGSDVIVSHGYNLKAPDGTLIPDWRSDSWQLVNGTWRELLFTGSGDTSPVARYGHSLFSMNGVVLLFAGDDGGRSGGAYTRGSYRNDVWELRGLGLSGSGKAEALEWRPAAVVSEGPAPRSMHSCTVVLLPSPEGSHLEEAALCHGGIVRAPVPANATPPMLEQLGGWGGGHAV